MEGSLLHAQVCQCRCLCSHLQHIRSTLLQILEKIFIRVVKQQLFLCKLCILIATTYCFFILISFFAFSTVIPYLKTVSHVDKSRSV